MAQHFTLHKILKFGILHVYFQYSNDFKFYEDAMGCIELECNYEVFSLTARKLSNSALRKLE